MTSKLIILSVISAFFIASTECLQCWNCVGQDCDVYSSTSKNWELVTCPVGSVCQKTDFTFYSNQRNQSFDSYTVRSCSYETGCTWDRSKNCQKNPVEYAGRGCADRFCCGKDKCNGSENIKYHFFFVPFFIISLF